MASEITMAALVSRVGEARARNWDYSAAEVGPKTWSMILKSARCEDDSVEEATFMGIRIRCSDVPEGTLWPLEVVPK